MKAKIRILTRRIKRSYKKDREQWIKGGILTVILLGMWEENGESTRRRVAGRNEDHADSYSNTYAGTSPGK